MEAGVRNRLGWGFAVLAGLVGVSAVGAPPWKLYKGREGYTIAYPSGWIFESDKAGFWMYNGQRKDLVQSMFGDHRALIYVGVNSDAKISAQNGEKILFDDNIKINRNRTSACSEVRKTQFDYELAPKSHQIETSLLCHYNKYWINVFYITWRGDFMQSKYDRLAMDMIESIRAVPG
jgi:hypothetical protein